MRSTHAAEGYISYSWYIQEYNYLQYLHGTINFITLPTASNVSQHIWFRTIDNRYTIVILLILSMDIDSTFFFLSTYFCYVQGLLTFDIKGFLNMLTVLGNKFWSLHSSLTKATIKKCSISKFNCGGKCVRFPFRKSGTGDNERCTLGTLLLLRYY